MVTLVELKIEVRRMMEEVVEKRSKLKGKMGLLSLDGLKRISAWAIKPIYRLAVL
jgi:isoaspartyl peptidase/L-asparaginase-like protein (Ntn-hydrolase superfamily)